MIDMSADASVSAVRKPFGVGVIGATGFIGTPYRAEIRAVPQEAKLVALCARRRDLLEAAGREDGAPLLTDDWRQVVEHPGVNLVVVATPDAMHYEAVMACASAGKHVVCEKPVGMNATEAVDMWRVYRDAHLAHFVPFWTRYAPIFVRAREIVKRGTLGEIKGVVYRWHNPRPAGMPFTWRDDAVLSAAGSLADVGSHAYDTLRWLLGDEAERVLVHADVITPAKPDLGSINLDEALRRGSEGEAKESQRQRPGTAFDFASISMALRSGAVGVIVLSHATYFRKGLAPEVELHGTLASLALDRVAGRLTLAEPGKTPAELESIADAGNTNRFAKYVFPALRRQLAGERADHPNLEDGWRVQLFTDAAVRSAHEGCWARVEEGHAEKSDTSHG